MLLLLSIFLLGIIAMYFYLTSNYTYWKKRGVSGPKPSLLFGNVKELTLLRTTMAHAFQRIYDQFQNEPYVGIYELRTPALILRDRKLIKDVLIKDFHHFNGRGTALNESTDPLSANLINLTGSRWRLLRTKLTPAFTTARIRNIFTLVAKAAKRYNEFARRYADTEKPVEMRDLAAKFTTEIISQCCFGLETSPFQDEDCEFRRICRKVIELDFIIILKRLVRIYMPEVFTALKFNLNPREVTRYIMKIVKDLIQHRVKHNVVRNDFLQVFMEIMNDKNENQGSGNASERKLKNETRQLDSIDDNLIAAQIYIFLLAGFDTSSASISYAMYELAANPDIQEKLCEEIKRVLAKHGSLSYDAISDMFYLDQVTKETLRKYPPVGVVARLCNEQYVLPGTDVVIEKGTKVYVPVHAIHHDPELYPNPNQFDPDRFLDDRTTKAHDSCKYLPFGAGPRMCIATRFGYMQIKTAIVALLTDYEVIPNSKTSTSLEFDTGAFNLTTTTGIWLSLRHRQNAALTLSKIN